MLANLLLLILNFAGGFLSLMLLARFFMQWQRVSFHNEIGQFVIATTDWCVRPLRRVLPGLFGLDMASLLPAWVVQTVLAFASLAARGVPFGDNIAGVLLGVWGIGLVDLMQLMVYMVIGIVLISAVFSWVNPHAPMAPLFFTLAAPFLRPFRKLIPLVANVDLSPLVLLLVLQILLMLLARIGGAFTPLIVGL
ncbi:YggT family protein [Nitrogeniibacter mangrovi]|uniref:YggT family protein n=1 Tax=Nitrogeniibacter mangrovi TaxID=2016596 RepID=A0A6C1B1N0_9RHOO|nr:YggT family protein [Nitrogeniibacter mangrovi]QID16889.1 YggT family protein [Nitrogeniibacter mangrovi]